MEKIEEFIWIMIGLLIFFTILFFAIGGGFNKSTYPKPSEEEYDPYDVAPRSILP